MRLVGFDTETFLSRTGYMIPDLVCLQVADSESGEAAIYGRGEALGVWAALLTGAVEGKWILVGHHIAFDLSVLLKYAPSTASLIFEALDKNCFIDTFLMEKLRALYDGDPQSNKGLALLCEQFLGKQLDKGADGWRLRYSELVATPVRDWPERARDYALDDVVVLPQVVHALLEFYAARYPSDLLNDLPSQIRHALALQITGAEGLPIDAEALHAKTQAVISDIRTIGRELQQYAIVDRDGTLKKKPQQDLVVQVFGDKAARTDPTAKFPHGQVQTDKMQMVMSGHPILMKAARYNGLQAKVLGTYLAWFQQARNGRLTSNAPNKSGKEGRIDSCLATGRAAMGLHMTLPKVGGLREIVTAPKGKVFINCDYDTAELRSLGQAGIWITGASKLAEVFKRPGADPHTDLAAQILRISTEEAYALKKQKDKAMKRARDTAKGPNFGFPGGMKPPRFVAQQMEETVKDFFITGKWPDETLTEDRAWQLYKLWERAWPENAAIFRWVKSQLNVDGQGIFRSPFSGRYRGGVGFCDGANYQFQSVTADGAKNALYEIIKATYNPNHILSHARVINFIHDEIMLEADEAYASECADAVAEIMCACMQIVTPDVPTGTSPALTRVWLKGAESAKENGRWTIVEAG